MPGKESVQDDAAAPDVDGGAFILAFPNNFGGCIVGTATGGFEESAVFHEIGEAEVDDLDDFVAIDEYVFGFEVAVGDKVGVCVGHSADDLFEEEAGVFLADVIVLDVVVELAAFCVFHDDEDVVGGVEHLIQFDDVLVVDKLEDAYFSLDLEWGPEVLWISYVCFSSCACL